jgi:hypothetical protein
MKDTFEQPSKNSESEGISADPQKKYFKITKVKGDSKKKRDVKLAMKKEEITREEIKEKSVDDVEEVQDRKRKKHKTTEYYYLLERKALRMMRRYYKDAFEAYASKYKYKQNLKKLDRATADQYYREYVAKEFDRNQDTLLEIGSQELVLALETIILCDRYAKKERVIEGLDFEEIRNLLNKYNTKNLKEFFKKTAHAFLFSHYFRMNSGSDVKSQSHVDQDKLGKQMESLFKKSLEALPDSIKATVTKSKY